MIVNQRNQLNQMSNIYFYDLFRLIHNIDSFKDTAENARKILDESFANLISMINRYFL